MKNLKEVDGKKLHTEMLNAAEKAVAGKGDGRISHSDAHELVKHLENDPHELAQETIAHIQSNYKLTTKANDVFENHALVIGSGKELIVGDNNQQSTPPSMNEIAKKTTMTAAGFFPGGSLLGLMLSLYWPDENNQDAYWDNLEKNIERYVDKKLAAAQIKNLNILLNGSNGKGGIHGWVSNAELVKSKKDPTDYLSDLNSIITNLKTDSAFYFNNDDARNTITYFMQMACVHLGALASMIKKLEDCGLSKYDEHHSLDWYKGEYYSSGSSKANYLGTYYKHAIQSAYKCFHSRMKQLIRNPKCQGAEKTVTNRVTAGGRSWDSSYTFYRWYVLDWFLYDNPAGGSAPVLDTGHNPDEGEIDHQFNYCCTASDKYYWHLRSTSSKYWRDNVVSVAQSWALGAYISYGLEKLKKIGLGSPLLSDSDPIILGDKKIAYIKDGDIFYGWEGDLWWETKKFNQTSKVGDTIARYAQDSIMFTNKDNQLKQIWDIGSEGQGSKVFTFDGKGGKTNGKLLNVKMDTITTVPNPNGESYLFFINNDGKINQFAYEGEWVYREFPYIGNYFTKQAQLVGLLWNEESHIFAFDSGKNLLDIVYKDGSMTSHVIQQNCSVTNFELQVQEGSEDIVSLYYVDSGGCVQQVNYHKNKEVETYNLTDYNSKYKNVKNRMVLTDSVATGYKAYFRDDSTLYCMSKIYNPAKFEVETIKKFAPTNGKGYSLATDASPVACPSGGVYIRDENGVIYYFVKDGSVWTESILIDNDDLI